MQILFTILSFIFGTILGSFLNVVILRLPEEKTLLGRSSCMSCGRTLLWWEMIPVFSWVFLRAKCSKCKNKIHWRYPLVEFLTAILFTCGFLVVLPSTTIEIIHLLLVWLVMAIALVVFVIDLEHYLILDSVVLVASVGIFLFLLAMDILNGTGFWGSQIFSGLLGALSLSLLLGGLYKFSKGRWLGFGDVGLMIPFGLSLGLVSGFLALGIASIVGSVIGVLLIAFRRASWATHLPFGTFLAFAWIVTILYGQVIWQVYQNFILRGGFGVV